MSAPKRPAPEHRPERPFFVPIDPADPLVVRYADDRGFAAAMRRIDAAVAARVPRPHALQWSSWTDRETWTTTE